MQAWDVSSAYAHVVERTYALAEHESPVRPEKERKHFLNKFWKSFLSLFWL